MTELDFTARAELYLGRDWASAKAQGPRTFRTAAQAIRFALEEAAPVSLHGARLEIGNRAFAGDELTWLYRSPDYPFPRKADAAGAARRRSTQRRNRNGKVQLRRHRRALSQPSLRQIAADPVPALQHGG